MMMIEPFLAKELEQNLQALKSALKDIKILSYIHIWDT